MIKIGRRGSISGIDHRQRPAGPRRLSASRRQSGARADDACSTRCSTRASTTGPRISSRPISRSPRSMSATRRPTSSRRRRPPPSTSASTTPGRAETLQAEIHNRLDRASRRKKYRAGPRRADRLRSRLARPAERCLPHPRRQADRDALSGSVQPSPAASRRCRPPAARRMRASSRIIARWSSSAWSARPCTWSTSASRLPTSKR